MRPPLSRVTRARSGGLRVVLYHHLTDHPDELVDELRVSTPPALFEEHLEHFARRYNVVDLDQVLDGRLPSRALLITFDDGYRSVLDVAAPLLRRHGLPSVFFVSAAFVTPGSLPLDNLLCLLSHRVGPAELETALTGRPAEKQSLGELLDVVGGMAYERRVRLADELAARFDVDRARVRDESGLFLDAAELPRLSEFEIEVANHTRSHLHCRAIA